MDRQIIKKRAEHWIKQHKNLLESININFTLVDYDYGYWYANEGFLELIGAGSEFVLKLEDGLDLRSVLSPSEFDEVYNVVEPMELQLKNQKKNGKKNFFQWEADITNLKTGESIPALMAAALHIDEEGTHDFTYVTYTDLREQKQSQQQLEHEKNKLEAVLFGIGDFVSVYDLKGDLLLHNPHVPQIKPNLNETLLPLESDVKESITLNTAEGYRNYECKIKPVKNNQGSTFAYVEILRDITNELKLKKQEQEFHQMKLKIMHLELQSEMIGVSRSMRHIFNLIVKCADVDSTILIQGETGVGKELVAKAIHNRSSRQKCSFVAVNCGALPENLLESELFGHTKGAFTGAVSERKGLFYEAEGGTIFLDEVGDLNPMLQVKILRALQEKEIRPVGSDKSYSIDVRVIAATNKDLKKLAERNEYRFDLYYRLAVISIFVQPLRERKDDILPLAEHFIQRKTEEKKGKLKAKILNHASQQALLNYAWPGNIRELENCIEHVWAICRETIIKPEDLPVQIVFPEETLIGFHHDTPLQNQQSQEMDSGGQNRPDLKPWEEEEKNVIGRELVKQKGHRTKTAQALGMCRATLWRKIKEYGVKI